MARICTAPLLHFTWETEDADPSGGLHHQHQE
jgi:hypothetical protein